MPDETGATFFKGADLPQQSEIQTPIPGDVWPRVQASPDYLLRQTKNPIFTAMVQARLTSGENGIKEKQPGEGISLAPYQIGDQVAVELLAEDKKTSWVLLLQKQQKNISKATMMGVAGTNYVPPPEWALAGYAIKMESGEYEVCQPKEPIPVPVTGKLGSISTGEYDRETISPSRENTIYPTQGNVNIPATCKYGRLDLGKLQPEQDPALNFHHELFSNLRNSAVVGVFASKQR